VCETGPPHALFGAENRRIRAALDLSWCCDHPCRSSHTSWPHQPPSAAPNHPTKFDSESTPTATQPHTDRGSLASAVCSCQPCRSSTPLWRAAGRCWQSTARSQATSARWPWSACKTPPSLTTSSPSRQTPTPSTTWCTAATVSQAPVACGCFAHTCMAAAGTCAPALAGMLAPLASSSSARLACAALHAAAQAAARAHTTCCPLTWCALPRPRRTHQHTAFLVVADEAYGRQIPFAFLERLRDAFMEKFAERGHAAPENGLNSSFGCVAQCVRVCACGPVGAGSGDQRIVARHHAVRQRMQTGASSGTLVADTAAWPGPPARAHAAVP
jgi:hypothetical protein